MCASTLAQSLESRERSTRRVAEIATLGAIAALLAVLAFGTLHAILIVPIWSRLVGGLPAAIAASIALAWAFDSLSRTRGSTARMRDGALFGAAMFLTLLPATIVDAVLRRQGQRLGDTLSGMIAGIALFAVSGVGAGWFLSRRRGTAISFVAAALTLMVVSGGPLPITRSARGALLSLGVGGICVASGLVLAFLRPRVNDLFE
jgi:hypothetical protein